MDTWLKPRETVNYRYNILRQLGQGKLGCTYLAEDRHRFNEYCLLQEFAPHVNSPEALKKTVELFQRKAKVLYTLDHPQIPHFRELFPLQQGEKTRLFLVQDYIVGSTYRDMLNDRLHQGKLFREAEVIQLLLHLLPVLQYLHDKGIIHRDIRPDSIICREEDKLPILIDFGSVKQLSAVATAFFQQAQLLTGQIIQIGHRGYAPQEQMEQGLVSNHSDLYGLAATSLVLLTGKEPLQLIDPRTLTWNWLPELSLSSRLTGVLSKMLAKHPSDRYGSAQAVINDLTSPTPPSPVSASSATPATVIVAQEAVAPGITPPESATIIPSSLPETDTDTSMILTTSPQKNLLAGCLGKFFLILILILGSGTLGWWAGKAWISQVLDNKKPEKKEEFPPSSFEKPTSDISEEELQRKNEIRTRRRQLGIEHRLFTTLVDEVFGDNYPSQKGRSLSNDKEDASWREKWDKTAVQLLDTLGSLSTQALQGMGTYGENQRSFWKARANSLHLSSRALYDLVDGRFFQAFPDQENQSFLEKPIGQIWHGMAFDILTTLESGSIYEVLSLTPGESTLDKQETLQPGGGKAYVVKLEAAHRMELKLEGDRDLLLSIYSPTGNNNLLEDSQQHEWSGELSETGYYELTVVSKSDRPVQYQLSIKINDRE